MQNAGRPRSKTLADRACQLTAYRDTFPAYYRAMPLHLTRTILVAMIAICLAVFPVGMSRASASMSVPVPVAATGHSHPAGSGATHKHEHASAAASVQDQAQSSGDCAGHGKSGKDCPSACCGFGCHVFSVVLDVVLWAPLGRPIQLTTGNDEQVENGQPLFIERPPRSV